MKDIDFSKTQKLENLEIFSKEQIQEILIEICNSLKEKGYNPVTQIVGYILSGDPSYITNYKNARFLICKIERDELLEEIVNYYIINNA